MLSRTQNARKKTVSAIYAFNRTRHTATAHQACRSLLSKCCDQTHLGSSSPEVSLPESAPKMNAKQSKRNVMTNNNLPIGQPVRWKNDFEPCHRHRVAV